MGIFLIIFITIFSLGFGDWSSAELSTIKAKLNRHTIHIQIAETESDRARGLMYVRALPNNQGMLFVFPREFTPSFWMKNTFIPLSIAFLDKNLHIVDIQEMVPPKSMMEFELPKYTSRRPAILALEMNANWFRRHRVKEGTQLKLLSPAPTPLLARIQKGARPRSK